MVRGIIAALALSAAGFWLGEPTAGAFPLQQGWPITFPGFAANYPVRVADVDGDGTMEVVFRTNEKVGGDYSSKLYLVTSAGQNLSGWPKVLTDSGFGIPAMADMDNDGDLEIIVPRIWGSQPDEIDCWHEDGTTCVGWPISLSPSYNSQLMIADLYTNGSPEIVVRATESGHSVLYVLRADGSVLSGWPRHFDPGYGIGRPSVGDVTGDGMLEIIAAGWDYGLQKSVGRAFRTDGSELPGWPVVLDDFYAFSVVPSVADMDSDGQNEVLLVTEATGIYVVEADGSFSPGWPIDEPIYGNNPAIGDVDGDGRNEIVMAGHTNAGSCLDLIPVPVPWFDAFFVWNGEDGTRLPGFPSCILPDLGGQPAIGDIDGDGTMEILSSGGAGSALPWPSSYIWAVHRDGQVIGDFPVEINGYVGGGHVVLADLDGDGDIEIGTSVDNESTSNPQGAVIFWDLPGTYDPTKIEWPMTYHDVQNTNNHDFWSLIPGQVPSLQVPGAVLALVWLGLRLRRSRMTRRRSTGSVRSLSSTENER